MRPVREWYPPALETPAEQVDYFDWTYSIDPQVFVHPEPCKYVPVPPKLNKWI